MSTYNNVHRHPSYSEYLLLPNNDEVILQDARRMRSKQLQMAGDNAVQSLDETIINDPGALGLVATNAFQPKVDAAQFNNINSPKPEMSKQILQAAATMGGQTPEQLLQTQMRIGAETMQTPPTLDPQTALENALAIAQSGSDYPIPSHEGIGV